MPAIRQTLRYSEIVAVDLAENQINFADSEQDGHRVQVPIAKEDLNLYFKWSRQQGSDRPVGYIADIPGFKDCLNTCLSDGFTDLDGISTGLTFTTNSLVNTENRTGAVNDIIMSYVLYKVYGASTYNTANKVYNTADALHMLDNADVSVAVGTSINTNNARNGAIDQMFRDLLAANPGRFFDANGLQLTGLFETNTDVSGDGSWQMIEDDIIQIIVKFVFQQQVSRRVVSSQQQPTTAGGTAESVKEEVIIPAGSDFTIRLQLKATANRSQRRIDQLAGGGGGGGGGGGVSGWTIIEGQTAGAYLVNSFVGTLSNITVLPLTVNGTPVSGTSDFLLASRTELTNLTIPLGYSNIATGLCENCTNLTSVTINAELSEINPYSFSNCHALTTLSLNTSNLNILGNGAFYGCSNLSSFPVCSNLVEIQPECFKNCTSLSSFVFPTTLSELHSGCFWNTALGSITIPSSIELIGDGSFVFCNNLSNVILPNSIITIGKYAFQGTPLPKIILPSSLTTLDDTALCDTDLFDLTIPMACTTIGATVLNQTASLAYLYFEGPFVPIVGTNAFNTTNASSKAFYPAGSNDIAWQSALTSGNWPGQAIARTYEFTTSNNTVTGFSGSLQSFLFIPSALQGNEITTIGTAAFQGNMTLTQLVLSPALTTIEVAVFKNCENLSNVTLPASLTGIKEEAFYGCSGLVAINLPSIVTHLGAQAFYSCTSLQSLSIPGGITVIPENFIAGSFNLESITIQDSVTTINDYAFYGCIALTNVGIPSAVTSIGVSAFENCSALTLLFRSITVPTFGTDALKNTNPTGLLTIPAAANLSEWQSAVVAAGWTGTVEREI